MSDLQLDSTEDIKVAVNDVTLTTGREAIRQHLQIRFQTFLGEWFLDPDEGVPYYQEILKKNPLFSLVSDILKGVALDTPGITKLTKFELDYVTALRKLTLDLKCNSIEGEIDFSQLVEVG